MRIVDAQSQSSKYPGHCRFSTRGVPASMVLVRSSLRLQSGEHVWEPAWVGGVKVTRVWELSWGGDGRQGLRWCLSFLEMQSQITTNWAA